MKEVDLQTDIKKSVREQGGYCFKLSNAYTIGIPDLLLALPPFAPCIVEVKELGEVYDKFDLSLKVTPKQQHELMAISQVYGFDVSFILVGLVYKGQRLLVPLPKDAERLDYHAVIGCPNEWKRLVGGRYNMISIMDHIERIAYVDPR